MNGLVGIAFKDFTLLAADRTARFSIITLKNDENKIYKLSDSLIFGVIGEDGDSVQFAEYIEKNVKLYSMRNGFDISPASAAHFIQHNIAESLRTRSAYQVDSLLGGYNKLTNTAELYYLDHLGTQIKVPYIIHGYGGMLSTSILDRFYEANCNLEQGLEMLRKVINEIQKRLIVSMPVYSVVAVSKDGVQVLDDIRAGPQSIA